MDLTARQIARDIAYTLPMNKIVSASPLKINFRCHICGDSHKDQYKARGWFYEHKGELRYGCFNCNENMTFRHYLKTYHPDRWREYLLEQRKENGYTDKPKEESIEKFNKVIPVVKQTVMDGLATRLDLLQDGHPAKTYMQQRLIPEDKLGLFWFTMEWRELSNKVHAGTYINVDKEPRIVIPIYDKSMDITAIQGRALRAAEKNRYVTIKVNEDSNKIYGLERVNENDDVFFLEGPIDSVFIDNGLAIVGGNMSVQDAPFKGKRVWVLDNEPRSVDTCKRIKRYIEAGEKVVLWDNFRYTSKDVNDMILKEGATVSEVNQYLRRNIVSGLQAKMRFGRWCKCKV